MTSLHTDLSISSQTAYAQLLDAALATEHFRSVADLSGAFSSKMVKGHKYWYYQYSEPSGRLRQTFVGPDHDAVRDLIARKQQPAITTQLGPLAGSAIALGCEPVASKQLRVILRLAEYGFFRAGGVLVGTHAFLAYGNMLGVRWNDGARTEDIDFAHVGKNLSLALPSNIEVDTHNAIESLALGFLPISGLSGKAGASYLSPRDPSFRLDFLTTLHRGGEQAYEHPKLHVKLQPLKFMEYSLINVQQAVVFSAEGAVVVNIPHPARYALHKLIVFGERSGTFRTKSAKDLRQAAALLMLFKERRAWEIDEAWRDLVTRGKGWLTRITHGLDALNQAYPELEMRGWLRLP